MKTKVKTFREGIGRYFTCNCGALQAINTNMPWCSTCFVEYTIARTSITLDTEIRTDRFLWAKAVGRAGGLKIGTRQTARGGE